MDRRRALRRRRRHLLRHERAGHRHQSGRHGGGVVRSRRRTQRLVRLHGRLGDERSGSSSWRPRTTRVRHPSTPTRPSRRSCPSTPTRPRRQRRGARRARRRRQRPDGPALGVLSHYDAVVWYTGNDIITREPSWAAATSSLAIGGLFEVRDFINEGRRVLYTGKFARAPVHTGARQPALRPVRQRTVLVEPGDRGPVPPVERLGRPRRRRARVLVRGRDPRRQQGHRPRDRQPVRRDRRRQPATRLSWEFSRPDSAQNQDHSVVHHHQRPAAGGGLPAVRELGGRSL